MTKWKNPPKKRDLPTEETLLGLLADPSHARKHNFLDELGVTSARASQIAAFKQLSTGWFHHRRLRLTASAFGAAAGTNQYQSRVALLLSKLWPETVNITLPMRHGVATENLLAQAALQRLCRERGVEAPVQSSTPGLVIRPDLPYLGVSPDRLVQFKEEEPPVLVCVSLLSVWFSCLLAPLALVHPPQLTLVFSSLLFSSLMCRFLRY
jgi:YqaJ-like viral recombinase domain